MSYLCSIRRKRVCWIQFYGEKKKNVPFVARESEIITEMPAHLHVRLRV